jgi:Bifunctional DNA primase/polymerase, N-terminal
VNARQPREGAALRAALAYARIGWPVFPCIPGEKVPVTRHGFLDATTEPERIISWWRASPGRNVAIATGTPGPDVLDVDRHKNGSGFEAFSWLRREGLVPGGTAAVRTPSGGIHVYFTGSRQRSGHLPAHHLDFRGQGGYVVAPPSTVGGRSYVLVHCQRSDAAFNWSAARELLDPQPRRQDGHTDRQAHGHRDVTHLARWMASRPEGTRNESLFWAANRAIEAGDTDALNAIARAAQSAGLDEREVVRTIRSAQRGAERPCGREATD